VLIVDGGGTTIFILRERKATELALAENVDAAGKWTFRLMDLKFG